MKTKNENNEILIKVKAALLNSGDVRMRAFDAGEGLKGVTAKIVLRLVLGIGKPKQIHGSVLVGVVEANRCVDSGRKGVWRFVSLKAGNNTLNIISDTIIL